jgi:integrase/recombinase XerD
VKQRKAAGRREEPAAPSDPQGFEASLRDYLAYLHVRNYAPATLRTRERALARFVAWCAERGLLRPGEITRPMLERYQSSLFHYRKASSGAPLSFRSQNMLLTALRGFFRHLARQNAIPTNPAADLEMPREEKRLPRVVLTVEEAERILAQPNVNDLLGLRDRAILELLYSTGIRRRELRDLLLHDLDIERQTLFVRLGKGKKDRFVPVGERALAWVSKYLFEVRPRLLVPPDPGSLFLSLQGAPLALFTITDMARDYMLRSGVGKPGACHIFRHTMATLMLEGGADVRFIQEMLGHAHLETTQIYTRVSIQKLKAIHDATHPGAKLRRSTAPHGTRTTHDSERDALLSALAAEAAESDEQ